MPPAPYFRGDYPQPAQGRYAPPVGGRDCPQGHRQDRHGIKVKVRQTFGIQRVVHRQVGRGKCQGQHVGLFDPKLVREQVLDAFQKRRVPVGLKLLVRHRHRHKLMCGPRKTTPPPAGSDASGMMRLSGSFGSRRALRHGRGAAGRYRGAADPRGRQGKPARPPRGRLTAMCPIATFAPRSRHVFRPGIG